MHSNLILEIVGLARIPDIQQMVYARYYGIKQNFNTRSVCMSACQSLIGMNCYLLIAST